MASTFTRPLGALRKTLAAGRPSLTGLFSRTRRPDARHLLRFETLESRHLLNGDGVGVLADPLVSIPEDLQGAPGQVVIAPVNIDDADGVRAAEIHIQYDTALLDVEEEDSITLVSPDVQAGTVWAQTVSPPWANVDEDAGTIVVWMFDTEPLGPGAGSLIEIAFTIKSDAPIGTETLVNLVSVSLNEGEIPNPTDGKISVIAANHAPQGQDNTLTLLEDHTHVFSASDFGFSDPDDTPPDGLLAVGITTVPTTGSLMLDGTPVTAGQFIDVSEIDAGKLIFGPEENANGSPYASFTFQVQDDGGTAYGGEDTDPTPNTMTFDVTPVNDAPSGADNTVTTLEDTAYTFTTDDFGFSDPNDMPANALLAVEVITLPAVGSLTLDGMPVTAGQVISVTDIDAGKLVITPEGNANGTPYADFTFRVQDDGGTDNGGVDTSASQTLTIVVTPVNDAPSFTKGANQTLDEDDGAQTVPGWAAGVSPGPPDESGQVLDFIVTTDNDALFSALPAIDPGTGTLTYTPADHANGIATVTVELHDDGGTANDGDDTSDPQSFVITVNAVNDAPQVTVPGAQSVAENADKVISGISVQDIDAGTESIQVTLEVLHGTLTAKDSVSGGVPPGGITGNGTSQVILSGSVAQINATLSDAQGLTYRPETDYSGPDTLTVTANDQEHTGSGGAKTDAKTVAISVGLMARVSGFVYADTNGNGRPDEHEGVPGVLITLTGKDAPPPTWTDDHGWYEFRELLGGTYTIKETHPYCMIDGGDNTISNVEVAPAQDTVGQDFRELGLKPQYVYNRLYSTIVMPVGSEAWLALIRQIVADGERDAGRTPTSPPAVTQQILQQGSEVVVRGTNGDDDFAFVAADTGDGQHEVKLNGETHHFDASVVSSILFDGGLGVDTATLSGSPAADQFDAVVKSASLRGAGYVAEVVRTEKTTTNAGTGAAQDKAAIADSAADDVLRAEIDSASLAAFYYEHVLREFEEITALSSHGGQDKKAVDEAIDYLLTTDGPWIDL